MLIPQLRGLVVPPTHPGQGCGGRAHALARREGQSTKALLRTAVWRDAAASGCDERACGGGGASSGGGGIHGYEVPGEAGDSCGMQIGLGQGATRSALGQI
jgi:hypothetical protein